MPLSARKQPTGSGGGFAGTSGRGGRAAARDIGMGVQPRGHLVGVRQFQQAGFALKATFHKARHKPHPTRPHREIEMRKELEDVRAQPFYRASHQADDANLRIGGQTTTALLGGNQVAALADSLALSHVTHGAGVDDHQFRIGLVGGADMSRRFQQGRNGLAVAYVHLAAVGMDVESHG